MTEVNKLINDYYEDNSEFFTSSPCYEEQIYDAWVEASLLEVE